MSPQLERTLAVRLIQLAFSGGTIGSTPHPRPLSRKGRGEKEEEEVPACVKNRYRKALKPVMALPTIRFCI